MVQLVKPSETFEKEIFDYKKEMMDHGDVSLSGCGGLEKHNTYKAWVDAILVYKDRKTIPKSSKYVEGSQWLLVETSNNRVLGMVNIRHYLNDSLLRFGGHIGYSVRPSERNKGLGKLQLRLALDFLKALGETKILVTCDDHNISSYKTIESCGGKLENKLFSDDYGMVRRYWVSL